MAENIFHINGRVVDQQTGRGLGGLRVEAWDNDFIIEDLVGSKETDEHDRFCIVFDKRYYQEIIFDRKPDIYFKVFSDEELVHSTEDSVLWNVEKVAMLYFDKLVLLDPVAASWATFADRIIERIKRVLPNDRKS